MVSLVENGYEIHDSTPPELFGEYTSIEMTGLRSLFEGQQVIYPRRVGRGGPNREQRG